MADHNTIIEGTVKFRDGKKWKSRWCVMRKLSPVADCVQLQMYRDARARWAAGAGAGAARGRGAAGGGCKAALSLQQYLGCETGFTLDKQSNTLALLCRDVNALLAFDTRERLMQWQVKVQAHLGAARRYLVQVPACPRRALPPGPARLHLAGQRFALAAGVPPRLLGVWDIHYLRRYGVVENRFCFEGGSQCGKGEGLHVLVTDKAQEITDTFNLAALENLSPKRRPPASNASQGGECLQFYKAYQPNTQLSELAERCEGGQGAVGDRAGEVSWRSTERIMGYGDAASAVCAGGAGGGALSRCRSCMSKLGAMSRSSTAPLTPGARHFNPNWTMDCVTETGTDESACNTVSRSISSEVCRCQEQAPGRPPKPPRLDLCKERKAAMPLPGQVVRTRVTPADENSRPDPYENYDVPKLPSAEIDGEYYDTPKRLKECLNEDLFNISNENTLILKKHCGCFLRFGRTQREPSIIDADENVQSTHCPCQRVTDWANNWLKLPYCKRNDDDNLVPYKENIQPNASALEALYATVDLSSKKKGKVTLESAISESVNNKHQYYNDSSNCSLVNYENTNFALSLEYYENAKDLSRKSGLSPTNTDSPCANTNPVVFSREDIKCFLSKCDHTENQSTKNVAPAVSPSRTSDDYLMMEPNKIENKKMERDGATPASEYTPMSPIGEFANVITKHTTKTQVSKLFDGKSASHPTLCGVSMKILDRSVNIHVAVAEVHTRAPTQLVRHTDYRKRSSSADSSRFLDDVKEFEDVIDLHGSVSSIDTLRNLEVEAPVSPCGCRSNAGEVGGLESTRVTRVVRRSVSVPGGAGCRHSSSSNDSGVSSCSARAGADFEVLASEAAARCLTRRRRPASLPRRSRSTDPVSPSGATLQRAAQVPAKSSSAEAEVPVLSTKPARNVSESRSTSSGTSDMTDYMETLSLCSSHSSDAPTARRSVVVRQMTSTLRPRSGSEYHQVSPRARLTHGCSLHRHYANLSHDP